jgi:hypothetical protein
MSVFLVCIFSSSATLVLGRFLIGSIWPRRSKQSDNGVSEKRLSVRLIGGAFQVLISDAQVTRKPTKALVVNHSLGGLCILTPDKAAEGTILSLRTADAVRGVSWVQVQVCRCYACGVQYEIGCRFVGTAPTRFLHIFG